MLRLLAFLGAALLSATSSAQSEPQTIEEIVVTAGFRDDALMSSAGSASVLEPELINARGARHLEDVLAAVPNVNFSVGGSRARFVQIRGVGDLEQFVDPKHYPSVGIVLDGIELANIATGSLLFDTEQVEVLRGPQGTRFGSSALAGLINIRGREPGDEFEADISSGYGNRDSWFVSAAAGGPVTDKFKARVALRQNSSDGFIDNDFLGRNDTQDIDELSVRGRFLLDLTSSLKADFTTLYIDSDNGYDAFSLSNTRTTLSDEPGRDAIEAVGLGGRIRWQVNPNHELQLLTTYTDSDETNSFDEDWVFRGFCDGVRCNPLFEFTASDQLDRERDQVSVDLRWLGAYRNIDFVLGAYTHQRDETLERQRFGLFVSDYETSRYALYGQMEFALMPRARLRLGIRGEAFDDEYSDTNAVQTQSNDTYWSGDATFEFDFADSSLLYLTLSRGAKPGGVNTSSVSVQPFVAARFDAFLSERSQFQTETVFNKEIGIKARYFDNRLAVRASAFHMDRSNAQLESWIWDATSFVFIGMLDNVDDAENYGVELEFDASLNPALSLIGRVGYLDTNVESMTVFDLALDDFRQLRDRDQTKAPRWQYHFSLNWQALEALSGNLAVEGRDESFFNYYHSEKLDAFTVVNASVRYQFQAAAIRLWARNLLNTEYANHGLYFANDPRDGFAINRAYEQFAEPRVYGVEVSYSF